MKQLSNKNIPHSILRKVKACKDMVILVLDGRRREVAKIFDDYAYAFYPGRTFVYDFDEYEILGELKK